MFLFASTLDMRDDLALLHVLSAVISPNPVVIFD